MPAPTLSWPARIAAVSERPEYQTATIQLRNPALVTPDYDIDTGVDTPIGNPILATDIQARIIGIRNDRFVNGAATDNPTGIQAIRIQIPFAAFPERIRRGYQVRVLDGGRNPALEDYLFTVEADSFGVNRASHTISAVVDVESFAGWDGEPPEDGGLWPSEDLWTGE